nr:MAG TPA: hypothetical protein [Caudoviricetes sp.]
MFSAKESNLDEYHTEIPFTTLSYTSLHLTILDFTLPYRTSLCNTVL